jgi:uncharacterized repeat protein (TIGR01451 family)
MVALVAAARSIPARHHRADRPDGGDVTGFRAVGLAAALALVLAGCGVAWAATAHGHRGAQLNVTKTVSPNPMVIGGDAVYTITVTNTGDAPAADVTTTDTLDGNLTAGTMPAGCTASGRTVTCGGSGTTLAPGGTLTYQIPVSVDPGISDGTNITNKVAVTSSTAGAYASTRLISQAYTMTDVEITKTGDQTVNPNGTITYTVVVTNHGPSDAVNVTVQDPTDGNLVAITGLPVECPASGLSITCPLGTLGPGESKTLTITVRADSDLADGTVITNCATVYTGSREVDTGNNHSCTSTTVNPVTPTASADLSVTKTGAPEVSPGGRITYTLVVTDNGPSAATGASVTIRDVIDNDALEVESISPGCSADPGTVTCDVGDLGVGESKTIKVTVKVKDDQVADSFITNCGMAMSTVADPVLGNNGACVRTRVVSDKPTASPSPSPTKTPAPKPTGHHPTKKPHHHHPGPNCRVRDSWSIPLRCSVH